MWACHIFWAGDSRAYVFESTGARQLTIDDLRDPGDALANLRRDSVVSNAMSADTEFRVNYRRVDLRAPFLVICATDGCFGYVPTPMHFEYLVLRRLQESRNTDVWSISLQTEIAAVTGDDAAMSTLGVGAEFKEFQKLFAPRVAELASAFIAPLDELRSAVTRAEQELEALRSRQLMEMTDRWNRYKSGYERYLRAKTAMEADESVGSDDIEQPEPSVKASADAAKKSSSELAAGDREVATEPLQPAEASGSIDESVADNDREASS
jgi:hypothetical protein